MDCAPPANLGWTPRSPSNSPTPATCRPSAASARLSQCAWPVRAPGRLAATRFRRPTSPGPGDSVSAAAAATQPEWPWRGGERAVQLFRGRRRNKTRMFRVTGETESVIGEGARRGPGPAGGASEHWVLRLSEGSGRGVAAGGRRLQPLELARPPSSSQ